jgi:gliding motility-associated protein GldM
MAGNTHGESPRQKMINLMYLVLLAMLALNVSSDVLQGFSLVDESLNRSTANATMQNQAIYKDFEEYMKKNPEKAGEWNERALHVKSISDSLYDLAEELKLRIVRTADGDDADVDNIENKEDLEAATTVMLAPISGKGEVLREAINNYRESILQMVTDTVQRRIISDNLSTAVPQSGLLLGKNWQEYMFENTPVVAAVTLLTKLQSDVRYAEGEVLHTLKNNIDVGDLRVNQIDAFVIPNSQSVVRGSKFSARIILAAVDSTQRPNIFIGGKQFNSETGVYEVICNSTGDYTLNGYMELEQGNGEVLRRDFSQKYTVVEPSATVSATLMNVLYAGYDNPISISVPGVPSNRIRATMSNGTLKPVAGGFIARPNEIGKDAEIIVSAEVEGRTQIMAKHTFRVRQLPDPMPFIEYTDQDGNVQRYRGGGASLLKGQLLQSEGIVAAIDDGLLNIGFRVISFETLFFDNMGNAVPEVSEGAKFSTRQKDLFRRLARGKRFFITGVKAVGPDGIERQLSTALEVKVQ